MALTLNLVSPVWAEESLQQILEKEVQKTIKELKASNKWGNEPCGGRIDVHGSITKRVAGKEAETYEMPFHVREPWGCHENPKSGVQKDSIQISSSIGAREYRRDGAEYSIHPDVIVVYNFDEFNDTSLEGVVLNSKGRPIQNAEVSIVEVRRNQAYPKVVTDAGGRYKFMVRSGLYRISAQKRGCASEPVEIEVCGWGKPSETEADKTRQAVFEQNVPMECGASGSLKVKGTRKLVSRFADGFLNAFDTNGGVQEGCLNVTIDPKSHAVSGGGTVVMSQISGSGWSTSPNGWDRGWLSANPIAYTYRVTGQESDGLINFSVECAKIGSISGSAQGYGCTDGGSCGEGSSSASEGPTDCPMHIIRFKLPWEANATYPHQKTVTMDEADIKIEIVDEVNFTLIPDEACSSSGLTSASAGGPQVTAAAPPPDLIRPGTIPADEQIIQMWQDDNSAEDASGEY